MLGGRKAERAGSRGVGRGARPEAQDDYGRGFIAAFKLSGNSVSQPQCPMPPPQFFCKFKFLDLVSKRFYGVRFRVQPSRRPKIRPAKSKKKLIVHRRVRSLRPLRAAGSRLYEPEALGPMAYAPVGER
jgi:hypothetical protein